MPDPADENSWWPVRGVRWDSPLCMCSPAWRLEILPVIIHPELRLQLARHRIQRIWMLLCHSGMLVHSSLMAFCLSDWQPTNKITEFQSEHWGLRDYTQLTTFRKPRFPKSWGAATRRLTRRVPESCNWDTRNDIVTRSSKQTTSRKSRNNCDIYALEPASRILDPRLRIQDCGSTASNPGSWIRTLCPGAQIRSGTRNRPMGSWCNQGQVTATGRVRFRCSKRSGYWYIFTLNWVHNFSSVQTNCIIYTLSIIKWSQINTLYFSWRIIILRTIINVCLYIWFKLELEIFHIV